MTSEDDVDELKAKLICHRCIGEPYLKRKVRHKGHTGQCSYCGQRGRSYSLEDIAALIETAFEQHYRLTSDQPTGWQMALLSDRESDYEWEREGEPVVWAIANAAVIPDQAAEDIQAILEDQYYDMDAAAMGEETEFSSGTYYAEAMPSDDVWQNEWREFERSLKTEARFFSKSSANHLAGIFNGIDKMPTTDGRPLVVEAGPSTKITAVYRARVFQSNERLKESLCRPDQHLGPPPSTLANAGRMNARGISVFYAANDPKVAIAEVRPPVGSQVAVARFEIIRPLRLLDLTALNTVTADGSIFDLEWAAKLEHITFLRSLSRRITRPVMPDDEVFEYLPTQAIADFLATENEPLLDGIIFPSTQAAGDGLNIVLFHKAARVEAIDIPKEAEITASTGHMTGDGWETEYSVSERMLLRKPAKEIGEHNPFFDALAFLPRPWDPEGSDTRHKTLRIDLKMVNIHVVQSAQYKCSTYDVRRYRWEAK